jgi:hypothetical protein
MYCQILKTNHPNSLKPELIAQFLLPGRRRSQAINRYGGIAQSSASLLDATVTPYLLPPEQLREVWSRYRPGRNGGGQIKILEGSCSLTLRPMMNMHRICRIRMCAMIWRPQVS